MNLGPTGQCQAAMASQAPYQEESKVCGQESLEGQKKFSHFSVKPCLVQTNLMEQAREKARKVPVLRIHVAHSGGFGHENAAFDTLRSWLYLSCPRKVEIVVNAHPGLLEKLKVFIPGYKPEDKHDQDAMVFGVSCKVINYFHNQDLDLLPIGIAGSLANHANHPGLIKLRTVIHVEPYSWCPFDVVYRGETRLPLEGDFSRMHLWAPPENYCLTDQEICESINNSGFPAETLQIVQWIIRQHRTREANTGLIYGSHCLSQGEVIRTLTAIANAVEGTGKQSPSIFLFIDSLNENLGVRHLHTYVDEKTHFISESDFQELSQPAKNGHSYFVHVRKLPKPVFEHMVAIGRLPLFFEGANTLQLAQVLGKPCLSLYLWRNNTLPPKLEGYEDCYEKQIITSSLLQIKWLKLKEWGVFLHNLKDADKTSLDKICIKLKRLTDFSGQLLSEIYRVVSEVNAEQGFKIDEKLKDCLFGMAFTVTPNFDNQHITYSTLQNFFSTNFDPDFLKQHDLEENSPKVNFFVELLSGNYLKDYSDYIYKVTVAHVSHYIRESLDVNSRISQCAGALQYEASKPGNNKLVNFLVQIPDEYFE